MSKPGHDVAVQKFYHQEVSAQIDFRSALHAVLEIADSFQVPGEFFCKADVDRLQLALSRIQAKMAVNQTGADVKNRLIRDFGLKPENIQMASYPPDSGNDGIRSDNS